ncbi:MAG TPA: universal stress protein [Acidimicrobiales bacterium]|nr:universal stress protein [Acidimicrobiales bacterium]
MADRGRLRTYLGTAPGVGKTYAMLSEGRRRAEAGERVVIGWIEPHGRAETRAQGADLEIVPVRTATYRGLDFVDLDIEAVIARHADVVLVDELAHTVADGTRRRWEDVADLLATGSDVLTTANVANLVSTRDYVARITGTGTVESVPDEFVRSGEVVLVDVPAEALRQRIASGRVYSTESVGGALARYFRVCNLEALSELGRAWMAGKVDSVGSDLLTRHGLEEIAPRPLVVAGVSDSQWGEHVIRRAAELAITDDADLLVAHVNLADGLGRRRNGVLDRYRALTTELGGTYTEVNGSTPAEALADTARARRARRVVVARHRSRLGEMVRGSVAARLRRLLPEVTVDEVHNNG